MIQTFTTFQEEMRNMGLRLEQNLNKVGERVSRLERPQRMGAIRNPPPQQVVPQDDDMPELEEDPPDQQRAPQNQPHIRRRDPNNRNRIRDDGQWQNASDLKMTPPTFAGKVDPDAYLDWEKRMEYIYECYDYSEAKKVAFAAAQLTEHALAWWDKEMAERRRYRYGPLTSWDEMKAALRRRYVPPHYHRDLQRKFRKLFQGQKSVEEYYDEFEIIRNILELEETEETLMSHFLEGLNDRIARKVERHPYHQLQELLHLAIQVEQQIKKKTSAAQKIKSNPPPTWSSTPQPIDKGKAIEIES